MTENALTKFSIEDREAQSRLVKAMAAVRTAALQVISAALDRDCERLREAEEIVLKFRADLIKITKWWPPAADGPLKLSESSAVLLGTLPDLDRVRFIGSETAAGPCKRLLDQLSRDPAAELAPAAE
jgi:hypothetical protein